MLFDWSDSLVVVKPATLIRWHRDQPESDDNVSAQTRINDVLLYFDREAYMSNLMQRITIESGKRGGKPCIRGLRITVYDVLEYLASGMSQEEILADFPDLEADDIRACLQFAADRERKLVKVPA